MTKILFIAIVNTVGASQWNESTYILGKARYCKVYSIFPRTPVLCLWYREDGKQLLVIISFNTLKQQGISTVTVTYMPFTSCRIHNGTKIGFRCWHITPCRVIWKHRTCKMIVNYILRSVWLFYSLCNFVCNTRGSVKSIDPSPSD